jgi:hypothetical protein
MFAKFYETDLFTEFIIDFLHLAPNHLLHLLGQPLENPTGLIIDLLRLLHALKSYLFLYNPIPY